VIDISQFLTSDGFIRQRAIWIPGRAQRYDVVLTFTLDGFLDPPAANRLGLKHCDITGG